MSKNKGTNTKKQTVAQPGNTPSDVLARMDELIERRSEINKRIAEIKKEYELIYSKRQQFQTTKFDLQNRVRGLPEKDNLYSELNTKLKQVELDSVLNEEHFKRLDEEITRLETVELPACTITVCAEDVMEHHRQVKQALVVVEGIQAAIDSQNQLITKTKAAIPDVTNRQQERYDLLADIAMGNAGEKNLKDLDAVIEKEQNAVSVAENKAEPVIANAKATVSGLQHKLATANAALHKLESKSSEVAQLYFMGEAEKAAVQYVNNALSLKEQHQRLLGLDWVLNKRDGCSIVYPGAKPIQIPLFKLPQFDGLGNPSSRERALLNGDQIYVDQISKAADTEETRFKAIVAGHCYS